MNELSIYIKTVIIVILLKPVIKGILPGNNMDKYINFVMGIMIISLLVLPFSKESPKAVFDYSHDFEKMNYEEIQRLAVEKKIEQELNRKFNTNDVDVTLDNDFNIKDVTSTEQKKIKEYLGL